MRVTTPLLPSITQQEIKHQDLLLKHSEKEQETWHLELESQLIPSGEEFEHDLKAFWVFGGHLSCISISAYSDGYVWE